MNLEEMMRGITTGIFLCACFGLLSISNLKGTAIAENDRPAVSYPSARSSDKTVSLVGESGPGVFVDKGITGHGVEAYLSLTADLVVIDAKTKKTLWSIFAGGFWSELAFKDTRDEKTNENIVLLELRGKTADRRYFEIMTGKEKYLKNANGVFIASDEKEKDPGREVKIVDLYTGGDSAIEEKEYMKITSPREWEELWQRHSKRTAGDYEQREKLRFPFERLSEEQQKLYKESPAYQMDLATRKRPDKPDIDFGKNSVIALFQGKMVNCSGYNLTRAVEDGGVITLYIQGLYFQSFGPGSEGGAVASNPYIILVFPKSWDKVVVKNNVQDYIDGPPIWEIIAEFKG